MDKIDNAVAKVIKKIHEDLLNGKYKLESIDAYTSILVKGKEELVIWNSNGVDNCKIYNADGYKFPEFDKDLQAKVYKLAVTPTVHSLRRDLKRAKAKLKSASEAKSAASELVKDIRQRIINLKQ